MKTGELIRALAADALPAPAPQRRLLLALAAAVAVAGGAFVLVFGTRPDLGQALLRPDSGMKQAIGLISTAAALGAALRLLRPEARLGGWGWALLAAPALAAAALAATAATTPLALWPQRIVGQGVLPCFAGVIGIGLPVLGATLAAMRTGAPARPGQAGAVAGLLAGSAGAAVYALWCTDDSPMFWGVWYVLSVASVTLLGAVLGRRLLRW